VDKIIKRGSNNVRPTGVHGTQIVYTVGFGGISPPRSIERCSEVPVGVFFVPTALPDQIISYALDNAGGLGDTPTKKH